MRRWRKLLALVCIAAVALAAIVPASGAGDVLAILTPVWLAFQPDVLVAVVPDGTPSAGQSVPLRSVVAFRAPPPAVQA